MSLSACSPTAKNPPEGARPAVLREIPPRLFPDHLLLGLIHRRLGEQASVGVMQGWSLGHSIFQGLELGTLRQVPLFKGELPTLGSTCIRLG